MSQIFVLTLGNGQKREFEVSRSREFGWFSRVTFPDGSVYHSGACHTQEDAMREAKFIIAKRYHTAILACEPKDHVDEIAALKAKLATSQRGAQELYSAWSKLTGDYTELEDQNRRLQAENARMKAVVDAANKFVTADCRWEEDQMELKAEEDCPPDYWMEACGELHDAVSGLKTAKENP